MKEGNVTVCVMCSSFFIRRPNEANVSLRRKMLCDAAHTHNMDVREYNTVYAQSYPNPNDRVNILTRLTSTPLKHFSVVKRTGFVVAEVRRGGSSNCVAPGG